MTEYDRWKTSAPENSREQAIADMVYDMDDFQVLKECHLNGINLEGIFRQMRDKLVEYLCDRD